MIHELRSEQYNRAEALVHDGYTSVQLQTVLAGTNPGAVFADAAAAPETALVFHQGEAGFYFIGDPDNAAFLGDVVPFIRSVIPERLRAQHLHEFEFSGDSPEWSRVFRRLFAGTELSESTQRVYLLQDPALAPISPPQHVLPEGFALRAIDRRFRDDSALTNRSPIDDAVNQWWYGWDGFAEHGGGFAAVKHYEVAGWCMLDGQSHGMCAIGIGTDARHRGQGIATALAAEMVRWITDAGKTPYWECMGTNTLSIRLAEKCGLRLAFTYQLFGFEL
jgi:RimJ/RimL family protein N-acetyltransferase